VPLSEVVRFVTELVREFGIDYVTVGGVAVSSQAEPRATKDIDLVVVIKPDAVDSLLAAIEAKGLTISRKAAVSKKLKEGRAAKIIWDDKYSFDLRNATYTIDSEAIRTACGVRLERYGLDLKVASPEVLVVYKLANFDDTGRKDIRNIMRVHDDLDWEYIKKQASILDTEYPGKDILANLEEALKWRRKSGG